MNRLQGVTKEETGAQEKLRSRLAQVDTTGVDDLEKKYREEKKLDEWNGSNRERKLEYNRQAVEFENYMRDVMQYGQDASGIGKQYYSPEQLDELSARSADLQERSKAAADTWKRYGDGSDIGIEKWLEEEGETDWQGIRDYYGQFRDENDYLTKQNDAARAKRYADTSDEALQSRRETLSGERQTEADRIIESAGEGFSAYEEAKRKRDALRENGYYTETVNGEIRRVEATTGELERLDKIISENEDDYNRFVTNSLAQRTRTAELNDIGAEQQRRENNAAAGRYYDTYQKYIQKYGENFPSNKKAMAEYTADQYAAAAEEAAAKAAAANANKDAIDRYETDEEDAARYAEEIIAGRSYEEIADEAKAAGVLPYQYESYLRQKYIDEIATKRQTQNRTEKEYEDARDQLVFLADYYRYQAADDFEELSAMSDVERAAILPKLQANYGAGRYIEPTEEELAIISYVEKKYGMNSEEMRRLIEGDGYGLSNLWNERHTQKLRGTAQELADAGRVARVALTLLSVPLNIIGGLTAMPMNMAALFGADVDSNSPTYALSRAATATREAIGKHAARWFGGAKATDDGMTWGEFTYNAVVSALDSAANAALARIGVGELGVGAGLTGEAAREAIATATAETMSAIMGTQVFTNTFIEDTDAGVDPQKAAVHGLVSAVIEGVTEKYSAEVIFSQIPSFAGKSITDWHTWANGLRNMGVAFLSEGSEEAVGVFLETIADVVLNEGDAAIFRNYDKYRGEGMTNQEAFSKVFMDVIKDAEMSFLAGGLSGIALGAAHTAIGYAAERNEARKIANIVTSTETVTETGKSVRVRDYTGLLDLIERSNAAEADSEFFKIGGQIREKLAALAESNPEWTSDELAKRISVDEINALVGAYAAYVEQNGEIKQKIDREERVEDYSDAEFAFYAAGMNGKTFEDAQREAAYRIDEEDARRNYEEGKETARPTQVNDDLAPENFPSMKEVEQNENIPQSLQDAVRTGGTDALARYIAEKGASPETAEKLAGYIMRVGEGGGLTLEERKELYGSPSAIETMNELYGTSIGNNMEDDIEILNNLAAYSTNESARASVQMKANAQSFGNAGRQYIQIFQAATSRNKSREARRAITREIQRAYLEGSTGVKGKAKYEYLTPDEVKTMRRRGAKLGSAKNAVRAVNKNPGLQQSDLSEKLSEAERTAIDAEAKRLGVQVRIVADLNGADGLQNGTIILIAANAKDKLGEVTRHEFTHRMQDVSPREYKWYRDLAYKASGIDAVELMNSYNSAIAMIGGDMLTLEDALDEIAAKYAQKLGSEKVMRDMARNDLNFFKRVLSVIKEYAEILGERARAFWDKVIRAGDAALRAENAYARLQSEATRTVDRLNRDIRREQTQKAKMEAEKAAKEKDASRKTKTIKEKKAFVEIEGEEGSGKERYLFGGNRAKNAPLSMLEKAMQMETDGSSSEKIRKETGWFKSYDGKWRFEIDDSKARWKNKPAFEIHYDDDMTYRTAKLGEILEHSELYEAYPELADITVVVQPMNIGDQGNFSRSSKSIALSDILFEVKTEGYSKFLNGGRAQRIREIESTPEYREYSKFFEDEEYDDMDPVEWLDLQKEAQDKFFGSELGKEYYSLKWGEGARYSGAKYQFGMTDEGKSVLLHEIQHAVQEIEDFARGANADSENYANTAGEIEARDVQARRDMTAEQRKNTRPDIDREDAVFAEGSTSISFSSKIDEYPYDMQTVIKEYLSSDDDEIVDFINEFKQTKKFGRKEISKPSQKLIKDIKEILGINIEDYSNYINTNAIRHIERRHGEHGEADNSMRNIKDISRIGYVLDNYDTIQLAKKGDDKVDSTEFRNYKNEMTPMVKIAKKINGTYYTVIAVPESKYKKLWVVSAYISKQEALTQAPSEQSGRMFLASRASDSRISQSDEVVNRNSENSLKNRMSISDKVLAEYADFRTKMEYQYRGQFNNEPDFSMTAEGIRRIAESYTNEYVGNQSYRDMMKRFSEIAKDIESYTKEPNGETFGIIMEETYDLAEEIVANTLEGSQSYQKAVGVRGYLRSVRINVPQELRAQLRYPGGFEMFRKQNFGKMFFLGKDAPAGDGKSITEVYRNLQQKFGKELFPYEAENEEAMLLNISDVATLSNRLLINPYAGVNPETAIGYMQMSILQSFSEAGSALAKENPKIQAFRKKLDEQRRMYDRALEQIQLRQNQLVKDELQRIADKDAKRIQDRKDAEARQKLLWAFQRLKGMEKKLDAANRAEIEKLIGGFDTIAASLSLKGVRKLTDIAILYTKLKEEKGENFIPNKRIEEAISRLSEKHIADLKSEDVRTLYEDAKAMIEVMQSILTERENEKRLIDFGDDRDIEELATESVMDIAGSYGVRGGSIWNDLNKYLTVNQLSSLRFFRRITGYKDNDPMMKMWQQLNQGQMTAMKYQLDAADKFRTWFEDSDYMASLHGKKADVLEGTFVSYLASERENEQDEIGKPKLVKTKLTMTRGMMISLYLHALSDDNMLHISLGGLTLPDIAELKKGKIAEAYARTPNDKAPARIAERSEIMRFWNENATDKDKAFANAIHDFFGSFSKNRLNEVSRKLLGYDIAEVLNYFPINTDLNFIFTSFESIKRDGSIEALGAFKSRTKGANNPIYLRDVVDVLQQYIRIQARYIGLAIPLRNFNRLYNQPQRIYQPTYEQEQEANDLKVAFDRAQARENKEEQAIPVIGKNRNNTFYSIKRQLGVSYGEQAQSYMEKLITDLNDGGGQQNEDFGSWYAKLRGMYAGATLALNLSVTAKQMASYPSAAAVIGWKALSQALASREKVDPALVYKYTPLLEYRSQGYSSAELGDLAAQKKLPKKWLNWIQGADVLTTTKLWLASEFYVRENFASYQIGSDGYYKKVAEIYNRVIEETQPNYTTMQRPQILRSNDQLTKGLVMFKTQLFQNYNILYDAVWDYRTKLQNYKLDNTSENKTALKEAGKNLRNAVTSQVTAAFIVAAVNLGYSWLLKKKKYKDEEGETEGNKLLEEFFVDLGDSMASMVLFGNEIYSFIASKFTGEKFYDIDDTTLSLVKDLRKTLDNLLNMTKWKSNTPIQNTEYAVKILEDVLRAVGLPAKNVDTLVRGMMYDVADWVGGIRGEYIYNLVDADIVRINDSGNTVPTSDTYNLLYRAIKSGNEEFYTMAVQDLIDRGVDPETIEEEMQSRAKKDESFDGGALGDLAGINLAVKPQKQTVEVPMFELSDLSGEQYITFANRRAEILSAIDRNMQATDRNVVVAYKIANDTSTYAEQVASMEAAKEVPGKFYEASAWVKECYAYAGEDAKKAAHYIELRAAAANMKETGGLTKAEQVYAYMTQMDITDDDDFGELFGLFYDSYNTRKTTDAKGNEIEVAVDPEELGLTNREYAGYYTVYGSSRVENEKMYEAAAANLPLDTWLDIYVFKGANTKESVLEYIDSMELTRAQKDQVYLILDYGEKELRKAPWNY